MSQAGCLTPVAFETLVALWAGDLLAEESDTVEAHLFSCDVCATASDRLARIVAGVRGLIPPVISHAQRDRLLAEGMRLRHTLVDPESSAEAYFAPDVDLLVHVLKGNFSGAERVDVELLDPEGVSRLQLAHVPFDAQAGEVLIACQRHYQFDGALTGDPVFEVHVHEGGRQRESVRYFVRHIWA